MEQKATQIKNSSCVWSSFIRSYFVCRFFLLLKLRYKFLKRQRSPPYRLLFYFRFVVTFAKALAIVSRPSQCMYMNSCVLGLQVLRCLMQRGPLRSRLLVWNCRDCAADDSCVSYQRLVDIRHLDIRGPLWPQVFHLQGSFRWWWEFQGLRNLGQVACLLLDHFHELRMAWNKNKNKNDKALPRPEISGTSCTRAVRQDVECNCIVILHHA